MPKDSERTSVVFLLSFFSFFSFFASASVRGNENENDVLLQVGDAYVAAADDGRGWTIGNQFIRYSLGLDAGELGVREIVDPVSGRNWRRSNLTTADSFIGVAGQRVSIGAAATPFDRASVVEWRGGVRLDVAYRLPSVPLRITRSYACYPDSAVVEVWTTIQNDSARAVTLSDLTGYVLPIENGTVRHLTGLETSDALGGPFTLVEQTVANGASLELGAGDRSSTQHVPWFAVDAGDSQFFGGILWDGSWRLKLSRQNDVLSVQMGLPTFNTSLAAGASLEVPHAVFGMTNAVVADSSMALRGFIDRGIRRGRPYGAYVTYNTWFAYGTLIDEGSMVAEMEAAATIGVEQFVVDAGWWPGIDLADGVNFLKSWGAWTVDAVRFPNGLRALSNRAHQLGMRFGVWVEPERVTLETVDRPGLAQTRFLVLHEGRYDPSVPNERALSAQVCLADPEARDWIRSRLVQFIDDVRPDYLKWDNNYWINCNRKGHTHGAQDGNFAHIRGLQLVLEDLRQRYPDLEIENCASGGNRLSLGSLAYSDAGWMDDRTTPSMRVRHGLEGLSLVFPSPYLLSFLLPTAEEPITDDPRFDLPFLMRSRMSGSLGFSWRGTVMTDGLRTALARQVALYKRIRPIIRDSITFHLSRQVVQFAGTPWSGWDVVEHVAPASDGAVLLAFRTADAPPRLVVRLKGLRPERRYEVESADLGLVGVASGADLMTRGIEIEASTISRSHVLILHVQ